MKKTGITVQLSVDVRGKELVILTTVSDGKHKKQMKTRKKLR